MTEEHIVADWVLRAFLRSRTRRSDLGGSLIGPNEVWITPGEAISTARVVCRRCNNEWLSGLDNAAAQALKPLIRGRTDVVLGAEAQSAVSAWIFKCALIFDASQCGESGPLSTLRSGFAQERLAPPGSTICAGPAPQMPFTIDGIPEIAGLTCFGVRPTSGIANVSINLNASDGTTTALPPRQVPTPGWTVMLGRVNAIISGQRGPIVPTPEWRFQRIWPASAEAVTLSSVPCNLGVAG